MTRADFTVPGQPVGKARARSTRAGHHYTPPATVAYERAVGFSARPHFRAPIAGPVRLTVLAIFAPPPSWSRRKALATIGAMHGQRPDADNIAKAIGDGLNGIAWRDDAQVAEMHVSKVWGRTACVRVIVEAMDSDAAQSWPGVMAVDGAP